MGKKDLQEMYNCLIEFRDTIDKLIEIKQPTNSIKESLEDQFRKLNDYIKEHEILWKLHIGEADPMTIPTNDLEFLINENNLHLDLHSGLIPKIEDVLDNM